MSAVGREVTGRDLWISNGSMELQEVQAGGVWSTEVQRGGQYAGSLLLSPALASPSCTRVHLLPAVLRDRRLPWASAWGWEVTLTPGLPGGRTSQ